MFIFDKQKQKQKQIYKDLQGFTRSKYNKTKIWLKYIKFK